MKYLLLFILLTQAQANPLDLLQKDLKQNGWIAYKVPATKNTRSMCCWDKQDTSIQSCTPLLRQVLSRIFILFKQPVFG